MELVGGGTASQRIGRERLNQRKTLSKPQKARRGKKKKNDSRIKHKEEGKIVNGRGKPL